MSNEKIQKHTSNAMEVRETSVHYNRFNSNEGRVSLSRGDEKSEAPETVQPLSTRRKIQQNQKAIKNNNNKIWISFVVEIVAILLIFGSWIILSNMEA